MLVYVILGNLFSELDRWKLWQWLNNEYSPQELVIVNSRYIYIAQFQYL